MIRSHVASDLSTYLERASLESFHEIPGLAAENCFVGIEPVRTANDGTIGECFGLVEPDDEVNRSDQRRIICITHVEKPAFKAVKVSILVAAMCCHSIVLVAVDPRRAHEC